MKRSGLPLFGIAIATVLVFSLSLFASAQDGAGVYKARCAMCHGADGSKMTAHNLQSADVQKMSDAEISDIISNGKGKMPASHSLKPEDVKGVVDYVRTLKK
jgi:mono/diheme cytochrome c family protein